MDESTTFRSTAPRLMDQVRETLHFYHYAYNTEPVARMKLRAIRGWLLWFIPDYVALHPGYGTRPWVRLPTTTETSD